MGTPYKQVASLSYLPRTIVYGAFKQNVYDQIKPLKIRLNETVTTPAECATLVHRDHRTATAAEYSNVGGEWCTAVFEACVSQRFSMIIPFCRVFLAECVHDGVCRHGVIFDPVVQTCVFEP